MIATCKTRFYCTVTALLIVPYLFLHIIKRIPASYRESLWIPVLFCSKVIYFGSFALNVASVSLSCWKWDNMPLNLLEKDFSCDLMTCSEICACMFVCVSEGIMDLVADMDRGKAYLTVRRISSFESWKNKVPTEFKMSWYNWQRRFLKRRHPQKKLCRISSAITAAGFSRRLSWTCHGQFWNLMSSVTCTSRDRCTYSWCSCWCRDCVQSVHVTSFSHVYW